MWSQSALLELQCSGIPEEPRRGRLILQVCGGPELGISNPFSAATAANRSMVGVRGPGSVGLTAGLGHAEIAESLTTSVESDLGRGGGWSGSQNPIDKCVLWLILMHPGA